MKGLFGMVACSLCLSATVYAGTCQPPENQAGKICKTGSDKFQLVIHSNQTKVMDGTLRKSKKTSANGFTSFALISQCGTFKFILQPSHGMATLMNGAILDHRQKCSDVPFASIKKWYFEDLTQ